MSRETIRNIVRTMYDFQDQRIRMANRLKKKRDGSDQIGAEDIRLDDESIPVIVDVWQDTHDAEKKLAKALEKELKGFPVYKHYLKHVHGCGPLMSAVIIAEYDIHRADTVSKLWQFTGLNPGMVRGNVAKGSRKDGTFAIEKSDTLVRGDRRTPGFLSPFNGWLRTKMCGVLADSFIKLRSPYRKYYDDYKARLEQEEGWKDETKGHRANAAKRYMIKMFLRDLYVAWRTLEGLPVRPPYAEEYLGKRHSA